MDGGYYTRTNSGTHKESLLFGFLTPFQTMFNKLYKNTPCKLYCKDIQTVREKDSLLVCMCFPFQRAIKAEASHHLEHLVTGVCTRILVATVEKPCDKQLLIASCFFLCLLVQNS